MTDDIRALTAQARRGAGEPRVPRARRGASAPRASWRPRSRWRAAGCPGIPGLADAHDLLARILSDQGDLAGAFDAWTSALQLDPMRTQRAQGHRVPLLPRRRLGRGARSPAARRWRSIPTIRRSARRSADGGRAVRAIARGGGGPGESPRATALPSREPAAHAAAPASAGRTPSLFDGIDGGERGLLLIDGNGLRLAGELASPDGDDAGDRVAAQLAGRLAGGGAGDPAARPRELARDRGRVARRPPRAGAAHRGHGAARDPRPLGARSAGSALARRAGRARRAHVAGGAVMTATQDALDRVTRVPGVRGALLVAGDRRAGRGRAAHGRRRRPGRRGAHRRAWSAGWRRTAESAGLRPPVVRPAPRRGGQRARGSRTATTWCSSRWSAPDANLGLARLEMLDAAGRLA